MSQRSYDTLAPELAEYADRYADQLASRGYRVKVEEKNELGFPNTPTLLAKRQQTTLIIEVCPKINNHLLDSWSRYCKSNGKDFRVVACLPDYIIISTKDRTWLRALGCGLTIVSKENVEHLIAAQDLGLNISLPDRSSLPPKIRSLLGTAYDQFDDSLWREGFDEACKTFEIETRKYLKKLVRQKRTPLVTSKGPRNLTLGQIDKFTIGNLVDAFQQILNKTRADDVIGKTLISIKKDRNLRTHHKHKSLTESRLRKNVGGHMWAIITALKLI